LKTPWNFTTKEEEKVVRSRLGKKIEPMNTTPKDKLSKTPPHCDIQHCDIQVRHTNNGLLIDLCLMSIINKRMSNFQL
jgi:hypothetical protein